MNENKLLISLIPVYILIFTCFILAGIGGGQAIRVISESAPIPDRKCVIIDPGHGGIDGGATSCTGVYESVINLEISLRLKDLMHLLGIQTSMTRTTDTSIHTVGDTIAAQKVSDLKNRVQIANESQNAILVSIHQNHFTDDRYSGAQVFYSDSNESANLAKKLQSTLVQTLNPGSKREAKRGEGIYLLQKTQIPAILVECGFLSNHPEEALLRSDTYQKKLSAVIASVCSTYLHSTQ